MLTESKLKNWTVKFGREERVQHLMNQYRTFVSKNKIFQEFEKAFVEFREVCDEYRKDGEIGLGESEQIDRFLKEIGAKWKHISTELRCVQSLLEEVLAHWKRWNDNYDQLCKFVEDGFEVLKRDEAARMHYFNDISVWKERYLTLQVRLYYNGHSLMAEGMIL